MTRKVTLMRAAKEKARAADRVVAEVRRALKKALEARTERKRDIWHLYPRPPNSSK